MEFSRRDKKIISFHEFTLGRTATEARVNLCRTIGEITPSLHTIRLWFRQFRNRDFCLDEKPRSGRPVELNFDDLKHIIERDPRLSTRCLAEQLGDSHTSIKRHLGDLGKTYRYGVWIPHQLTSDQLDRRVDACLELRSSHRNFDWLNNLITGDEKWVLYVNHSCKRQRLSPREKGIPTPKKELHPKKVMLSVWWGTKGIIHWELLPNGRTITAEVYCEQLNRVAAALKNKQDRMYFFMTRLDHMLLCQPRKK